MYIYLDLLTRNQVFIYIMSLTLPDILIVLDKKKKKKKKSFPQFFLLLLLLWIDIFGAFKNECKNLPVLCACMSVTFFFFFLFPATLIQSKNSNTSRNQEIDNRNTVIPYTERMNHTQKETSDRCAFIKVKKYGKSNASLSYFFHVS